jgi:hypothetical protein
MEILHISWANIFYYKGVFIDWHNYCGPTLLRRNSHSNRKVLSDCIGEERHWKNISGRTWALVGKFARLSKEEREQYRIF